MAETDVAARPPLSAALSQLLVAFTIEADNTFEARMPHRTTAARQAGIDQPRGPWLTSLVMWADFLRLIPEDGCPFAEVAEAAELVNLAGLQRWRYIELQPEKPTRGEVQWVRLTRGGHATCRRWPSIPGEVEDRWRERWGAGALAALRAPLEAVADAAEVELPRYLPVGGAHRPRQWPPRTTRRPASELDLSVVLSRVLLLWAADFQRESKLPLSLCANALRAIDRGGVRVRDLTALTGIGKETVAVQLGRLERTGLAAVEPAPGAARTKQARLTDKGAAARRRYERLEADVETAWRARWGAGLHDAAEAFATTAGADGTSLLALGLEPYPDGWRASKPYAAQTAAWCRDPLAALPWHPVVSHRGGYPDGN